MDIEAAMKTLLDKITSNTTADDALRYTQAMLNLANARLRHDERPDGTH